MCFQIRIYWVDADHILREHCCDDGHSWYVGGLSSYNISVHVHSKLAACAWLTSSDWHIRVYFQAPDGAMHEWVWEDAGWRSGTTFTPPTPTVGSFLASTCDSPGLAPSIRVYYQTDDGFIRERVAGPDGWTTGRCRYRSCLAKSNCTQANHQNIHRYVCLPSTGGRVLYSTIWE